MSCRFTLKLTQGRREFCIPYTCLVFQKAPGNVLCRHNIHLMGYFEFLHDSRIVCLPLSISEKLHWRRGRTSSSSLLIQSNTLLSGEQHRPFKQARTNTIFVFFIWIPILYLVTFWSILSNQCSSCTSGINLVVIKYTFFNLVLTPNKFLRFSRFARRYVNSF